jgi:hypothetical protein
MQSMTIPGVVCRQTSRALLKKIVRQCRYITDSQFSNLAAADPLGFFDRGIAIFEDPSGVDQKRLTSRR